MIIILGLTFSSEQSRKELIQKVKFNKVVIANQQSRLMGIFRNEKNSKFILICDKQFASDTAACQQIIDDYDQIHSIIFLENEAKESEYPGPFLFVINKIADIPVIVESILEKNTSNGNDTVLETKDNVKLPHNEKAETIGEEESHDTSVSKEEDKKEEKSIDAGESPESKSNISEVSEILEGKSKQEVRTHQLSVEDRITSFKKEIGIAKLDRNKTIAVWSPIHKSGVTQFVINFGVYLSTRQVELCVHESVTNRPNLKRLLKIYSNKPDNWCSYAQYLFVRENPLPNRVKWLYQNLHWYPCDHKDSEFEWSREKINEYVLGLKHYDITLVDMPSGKLSKINMEVLRHVDELWIMASHSIGEWVEWTEYMKELQDIIPSIHVIFNSLHKNIPNPSEMIKEELMFNVLAQIPIDFEKCFLAEYSKSPLIMHDPEIARLWEESFYTLVEHLEIKHKKIYERDSNLKLNFRKLVAYFGSSRKL